MDVIRWVGWMIYSTHSKKKKTRQQLYPLSGDKKIKKRPPLTKERFLSLKKEFNLK